MITAGRRPLFLCAALWGSIAMSAWVAALAGLWTMPGPITGLSWHIHEMLFGFAGAVVGGFLLTAVPNWTGRPPLTGPPLAGLVGLWIAGRLILVLPISGDDAEWAQAISYGTAAATLAYPVALVTLVSRDLIAARYRRGLIVLALVGLWLIANAGFHWELWQNGVADMSVHVGVAALIMLISLIGGRIVPAFTRNWLTARGIDRVPAEFGTLDRVALLVTLAALAAWIWAPEEPATAGLCAGTGMLLLARLCRWRGGAVMRDPMLAVLHVGYGLIPAGFVALSVAALDPDLLSPSAALHIWTVGAVGIMAAAVMTRAFLGHAGLPIQADAAIATMFTALAVSVATRLGAALLDSIPMMAFSGIAWAGAFLIFFGRFLRLDPHGRHDRED